MELIDRSALLKKINDDDSALAIYRKINEAKSYSSAAVWIPVSGKDGSLPQRDGKYLCAWFDGERLRKEILYYGSPAELFAQKSPELVFKDGDYEKCFGMDICGTDRVVKLIVPAYWLSIPELPGVAIER